MTPSNRLVVWAAALSGNSLFYFGSSRFSRPGTVLPEVGLDHLITPTPWALVPYLSFFLIILVAFLAVPATRVRQLALAIVSSSAVAAVVFLLYPTTVHYPEFVGDGLVHLTVQYLRQADTPQNCLPSLHGAITALCVLALAPRLAGWRRLGLVAWGVAICWSAIALRQHLTVDIAAGVALGLASAAFWFRPGGHGSS